MRSFFLFFFFLISCGSAQAALEDHFKRVEHRAGNHRMRNIDFIYMINLDERPLKYESCVQQLDPYDIHPYRFSAVNGWDLSVDEINDIGVIFEPGMRTDLIGSYYSPDKKPYQEYMQRPGQTYFCHDMPLGCIGCVLSHLSVLQDAYDSGYETIWVMEDDIEVIQNPHIISDLIDSLDTIVGADKWDILFTDKDTKAQDGSYVLCLQHLPRPNFTPVDTSRFALRYPIGGLFLKIGARFGAYSMILRRSGIEKILRFIKTYKVFAAYDMDYFLPDDIRLYSVLQDVVSTQPKAPTDNRYPGYLNEST